MKTNLNDHQNKHTKTIKEVSISKKGIISNQISQYNRYLSSSLPKENKTLKKYINDRLNSINKKKINLCKSLIHQDPPPKSTEKYKSNLIYRRNNLNSNLKINQKSLDKSLKKNIIKERIYNKKSILTIKKNNTHNNNSNDNYKSVNIKKSDNSKLINSISTSAGMSSSSNKIDENSKMNYYDYHKNNYNLLNNSIEKSNTVCDKYNNNNRFFLDESNYCRPKINNFNYETGSDDNINENIIFLKCDNYSSLTFGNSFSYSNSQRSKKNNDENINNNNITFFFNNSNNNNKNNTYVNKLKEENEALKKELKESNDQISLLKYQIKELEEFNNHTNFKKSTRNIMFPPNLWDKRHLKYELFDSNSFNKINNTKELSMSYRINEKMKINKDMLENINNTLNEENFYKNKKKLINVKKNINLKKKGIKKNNEEFYSLYVLDKPCEKITECISNLRI